MDAVVTVAAGEEEGESRLLTEEPSVDLPSPKPGHDDIENRQIDLLPMFLKNTYRLFPVFRADHQVPRLFQNALVKLSDQGIVFGQEDGLLPSPVGGLFRFPISFGFSPSPPMGR